MIKQLLILCCAAGLFLTSRGNPLQRLLLPQTCNCPWNLQALLQTPKNGPYAPRIEPQNPTCPAQTCGAPSLDLNQLISPQNGPYAPYNKASESICPSQTFGVTQQSSLGLNQIIYDIILDKLGINKNINPDIYRGTNTPNINCNQDINNGVNSNYNHQNNRQFTRPVQNNINMCPTSHPRPSDPKLGPNNDPRVVNNYIIVPPDVFQDQQKCNKNVCKEKRNRRQDLENIEKTIEKTNQKINETKDRSSNEKSQSNRETRNQNMERKQEVSDEKPQRNKSRRRSRKRKNNNDSSLGSKTPEVTEDKQNKTTVFDNVVTAVIQKATDQSLQNQNGKIENYATESENTNNTEDVNLVTTEKNTKVGNDQTADPENFTTRSKTSNKRRSRKRKPKKDDTNKITHTRQANSKEDALIKDFSKKFPNIPEDLIVKLIDYMKIKLQDDQSSIFNAFDSYWNYPINFDEFYQAQFKNLKPNSEMTVQPRNNGSNRRQKQRNRRRKSKSRKQNANCDKVIELTPTDTRNKYEFKNSAEVTDSKSIVNEEPLIKEEQEIIDDIEKCDIELNKTSSDGVKLENMNEQTKPDKAHLVHSSLTSKVELIIENNTTKANNTIAYTDGNTEKKTNPSDTGEKSIEKPNAKYVKAVNIEPNPNERIINIKISVQPQKKHVEALLVDDGKYNNTNLLDEITKTKGSKTDDSADKLMTLKSTNNSDNSVEKTDTSKMKAKENYQINLDKVTTENHSESSGNINKLNQMENQINSDSRQETIVVHPRLESETIEAVENEINDYFPNFEAGNLAYLLQEDFDELKHINEGRYHYTTEVQLLRDDSSENYKYVNKGTPDKLIVDLNPENSKTYSEIEHTIQKPEIENLDKIEFMTPPTLEVPDFETKPIKKDQNDLDHFINYGDLRPQNVDLKPQNSDFKSQNYVENKLSAYSEHKNKSIYDKKPEIEIKSNSNNIETVFARSKVAKYGQQVNHDVIDESVTSEMSNVCDSDETADSKDKVTVILAQSY